MNGYEDFFKDVKKSIEKEFEKYDKNEKLKDLNIDNMVHKFKILDGREVEIIIRDISIFVDDHISYDMCVKIDGGGRVENTTSPIDKLAYNMEKFFYSIFGEVYLTANKYKETTN